MLALSLAARLQGVRTALAGRVVRVEVELEFVRRARMEFAEGVSVVAPVEGLRIRSLVGILSRVRWVLQEVRRSECLLNNGQRLRLLNNNNSSSHKNNNDNNSLLSNNNNSSNSSHRNNNDNNSSRRSNNNDNNNSNSSRRNSNNSSNRCSIRCSQTLYPGMGEACSPRVRKVRRVVCRGFAAIIRSEFV